MAADVASTKNVILSDEDFEALLADMMFDYDMFTGEHRERTSTKRLDTMKTIDGPVEYLKRAYMTELEHGMAGADSEYETNVTNDDVYKTLQIVKAHLMGVEHGKSPKEWIDFPAYYDFLWDMEEHGRKLY